MSVVWRVFMIPETMYVYLWARSIPVGAIEGLLLLVCLRLRSRRLMLLALFFPLLWEIGDDFRHGWQASEYVYAYGFVLAPNRWDGIRMVLPIALGYLVPAVVSGVVLYWLGIRSLRSDDRVKPVPLKNPSRGLPDPPVA